MHSALIVCADDSRGALAAVRSLGRAGWRVGVATPGRRSLAGGSRYTARHHLVPVARTDPAGFVRATADAVGAQGYDVVLAGGDDELVALSTAADDLGATAPSGRVVERALDKLSLARVVTGTGLRAPVTSDSAPSMGEPGPFVVKPRFAWSVSDGERSSPRLPAVMCSDAESARRVGQRMREQSVDPLFQQAIEGTLFAYAAVVDSDGVHHCRVAQRADRLWPTPAGISARARTVEIDDDLARGCESVLARLGWQGIVQLQFLENSNGERYLMDLNGRLYGSLSLAVEAGANLPLAWANLLLGVRPEGVDARVGATYQWLYGDVRRAFVERRGGLLRDVIGCAVTATGAAHSVWNLRDLAPAAVHATQLIRQATRRRR